MKHPLLSRFKGGLLGSYLGEVLGKSCRKSIFNPNRFNLSPRNLTSWSIVSTCALESLISYGSLNCKGWLERIRFRAPSILELEKTVTNSELAIATLPIALFFHETRYLQRANLRKSLDIWVGESCDHSNNLAWGHILHLILKEKLHPVNLIPQAIGYFQEKGMETPLVRQLQQVETFISQSTPLQKVTAHLSRQGHKSYTPIALAYYCFLTTPEDFRLALTRAVQTSYYPTLTGALTGALAGAYNGTSSIPCQWLLMTKKNPLAQKIALLTTQLFATWSGVQQPNSNQNLLDIAAVASSGIIQPRSQLRIISQEE